MRFTSRLLRDAIDFVCADEKAYNSILSRDNSTKLTMGSIIAKIVKVNEEKETALIKVGFDYHQFNKTSNTAEDLIVTLTWQKKRGFKIYKVLKYEEI